MWQRDQNLTVSSDTLRSLMIMEKAEGKSPSRILPLEGLKFERSRTLKDFTDRNDVKRDSSIWNVERQGFAI